MRRCEGRRGFSLLEVLAAVAILGILYATLARVGIQGVRSEGESKRRLEASLLADLQLSDIETGMDGQTPPEVGVTELEQDEFAITVEIEPYDLDGALAGDSVPETPAESPFRRVHVVVSWEEGFRELQVERTTYGFDPNGLQPAAPPDEEARP